MNSDSLLSIIRNLKGITVKKVEPQIPDKISLAKDSDSKSRNDNYDFSEMRDNQDTSPKSKKLERKSSEMNISRKREFSTGSSSSENTTLDPFKIPKKRLKSEERNRFSLNNFVINKKPKRRTARVLSDSESDSDSKSHEMIINADLEKFHNILNLNIDKSESEKNKSQVPNSKSDSEDEKSSPKRKKSKVNHSEINQENKDENTETTEKDNKELKNKSRRKRISNSCNKCPCNSDEKTIQNESKSIKRPTKNTSRNSKNSFSELESTKNEENDKNCEENLKSATEEKIPKIQNPSRNRRRKITEEKPDEETIKNCEENLESSKNRGQKSSKTTEKVAQPEEEKTGEENLENVPCSTVEETQAKTRISRRNQQRKSSKSLVEEKTCEENRENVEEPQSNIGRNRRQKSSRSLERKEAQPEEEKTGEENITIDEKNLENVTCTSLEETQPKTQNSSRNRRQKSSRSLERKESQPEEEKTGEENVTKDEKNLENVNCSSVEETQSKIQNSSRNRRQKRSLEGKISQPEEEKTGEENMESVEETQNSSRIRRQTSLKSLDRKISQTEEEKTGEENLENVEETQSKTQNFGRIRRQTSSKSLERKVSQSEEEKTGEENDKNEENLESASRLSLEEKVIQPEEKTDEEKTEENLESISSLSMDEKKTKRISTRILQRRSLTEKPDEKTFYEDKLNFKLPEVSVRLDSRAVDNWLAKYAVLASPCRILVERMSVTPEKPQEKPKKCLVLNRDWDRHIQPFPKRNFLLNFSENISEVTSKIESLKEAQMAEGFYSQSLENVSKLLVENEKPDNKIQKRTINRSLSDKEIPKTRFELNKSKPNPELNKRTTLNRSLSDKEIPKTRFELNKSKPNPELNKRTTLNRSLSDKEIPKPRQTIELNKPVYKVPKICKKQELISQNVRRLQIKTPERINEETKNTIISKPEKEIARTYKIIGNKPKFAHDDDVNEYVQENRIETTQSFMCADMEFLSHVYDRIKYRDSDYSYDDIEIVEEKYNWSPEEIENSEQTIAEILDTNMEQHKKHTVQQAENVPKKTEKTPEDIKKHYSHKKISSHRSENHEKKDLKKSSQEREIKTTKPSENIKNITDKNEPHKQIEKAKRPPSHEHRKIHKENTVKETENKLVKPTEQNLKLKRSSSEHKTNKETHENEKKLHKESHEKKDKDERDEKSKRSYSHDKEKVSVKEKPKRSSSSLDDKTKPKEDPKNIDHKKFKSDLEKPNTEEIFDKNKNIQPKNREVHAITAPNKSEELKITINNTPQPTQKPADLKTPAEVVPKTKVFKLEKEVKRPPSRPKKILLNRPSLVSSAESSPSGFKVPDSPAPQMVKPVLSQPVKLSPNVFKKPISPKKQEKEFDIISLYAASLGGIESLADTTTKESSSDSEDDFSVDSYIPEMDPDKQSKIDEWLNNTVQVCKANESIPVLPPVKVKQKNIFENVCYDFQKLGQGCRKKGCKSLHSLPDHWKDEILKLSVEEVMFVYKYSKNLEYLYKTIFSVVTARLGDLRDFNNLISMVKDVLELEMNSDRTPFVSDILAALCKTGVTFHSMVELVYKNANVNSKLLDLLSDILLTLTVDKNDAYENWYVIKTLITSKNYDIDTGMIQSIIKECLHGDPDTKDLYCKIYHDMLKKIADTKLNSIFESLLNNFYVRLKSHNYNKEASEFYERCKKLSITLGSTSDHCSPTTPTSCNTTPKSVLKCSPYIQPTSTILPQCFSVFTNPQPGTSTQQNFYPPVSKFVRPNFAPRQNFPTYPPNFQFRPNYRRNIPKINYNYDWYPPQQRNMQNLEHGKAFSAYDVNSAVYKEDIPVLLSLIIKYKDNDHTDLFIKTCFDALMESSHNFQTFFGKLIETARIPVATHLDDETSKYVVKTLGMNIVLHLFHQKNWEHAYNIYMMMKKYFTDDLFNVKIYVKEAHSYLKRIFIVAHLLLKKSNSELAWEIIRDSNFQINGAWTGDKSDINYRIIVIEELLFCIRNRSAFSSRRKPWDFGIEVIMYAVNHKIEIDLFTQINAIFLHALNNNCDVNFFMNFVRHSIPNWSHYIGKNIFRAIIVYAVQNKSFNFGKQIFLTAMTRDAYPTLFGNDRCVVFRTDYLQEEIHIILDDLFVKMIPFYPISHNVVIKIETATPYTEEVPKVLSQCATVDARTFQTRIANVLNNVIKPAVNICTGNNVISLDIKSLNNHLMDRLKFNI